MAMLVRLLPARAHKFARLGTSGYTGIRTSHVFRLRGSPEGKPLSQQHICREYHAATIRSYIVGREKVLSLRLVGFDNVPHNRGKLPLAVV